MRSYWLLLGFTGFETDLIGLNWVFVVCTKLYWLHGFYLVLSLIIVGFFIVSTLIYCWFLWVTALDLFVICLSSVFVCFCFLHFDVFCSFWSSNPSQIWTLERVRFNWVSLGFTGFLLGFTWLYWVLIGFDWFLIGFDWVLLSFNGFAWVWLGFSEYRLVLTEFYWVLLGFTGFYWVLLDFTGFY